MKLTGRDQEKLCLQVQIRIKKIRELVIRDPEAAHSAEDQLFEDVLKKIASGCSDPEAVARAALKSKKLDFSRWTS